VPIVDVTSPEAPQQIDAACRRIGFFCISGHGAPPSLAAALDRAAREFFALPEDEKARIAMAEGGLAWRGWFPLGGELTSGVPDAKEGLYFGAEDEADGRPLHGPNLFPGRPAALRTAVLAWLDAMTALGHRVMRLMAGGLGLDAGWFEAHLTADPTVLFRIFRYPPAGDGWGVAEHTDYGLLTILLQDDRGGLQVRGADGWVDVPPVPGVFVCNVGDMLDRMTGGRYRSTAHRVRNTSGRDRLSFPFFFDPSWNARIEPLPLVGAAPADDRDTRWDGASVHAWDGTYGDYLIAKVAKVFPALAAAGLSRQFENPTGRQTSAKRREGGP
jgi:isopenicillin N synthase-like dioxygenase